LVDWCCESSITSCCSIFRAANISCVSNPRCVSDNVLKSYHCDQLSIAVVLFDVVVDAAMVVSAVVEYSTSSNHCVLLFDDINDVALAEENDESNDFIGRSMTFPSPFIQP
jgi:hypothetical protein